MRPDIRLIEFIILFLLGPMLIATQVLSKEWIFPMLWLSFFYVLFILKREGALLLGYTIRRKELVIVLRRFFLLVPFIWLFGLALYPEKLFDFVRREPFIWALVVIFYPLVSVFVQEVVFRQFFYHRYRRFFNSRNSFILANAAVFSYAHIVFLNPVALFFTFVGGLIFAVTYLRSRSLMLVCFEHALYGDLIFTIGLGSFFYHRPF